MFKIDDLVKIAENRKHIWRVIDIQGDICVIIQAEWIKNRPWSRKIKEVITIKNNKLVKFGSEFFNTVSSSYTLITMPLLLAVQKV